MQESIQKCRSQMLVNIDSVDAMPNRSQLVLLKAGDRFTCEDNETGVEKSKRMIFKIIKERDAEYIIDVDDLTTNSSENSSICSPQPLSACSVDSTNSKHLS